ncbi:MAG: 2-C-methyl-D-erythritol 4-phosphate cytidylyltransferase [Nitrospinaceae bacterium]|jgi:2-C-methyl-D-erythritol 4-phosphate cytidylyltransferase|nr:MAG: 2-C-methyl-D-erythritol 4-phosphate cytidylyltransferase [Nitrospinaceae bacterium]
MKVSVIIPAAGQGRRMEAGVSKQFLLLGGEPILKRTLEVFLNEPSVSAVTLVVPEADVEAVSGEFGGGRGKLSEVVAGGKERQDSVHNGLKSLSADTDVVLVHDGVRPFVTPQMIRAAARAALDHGAAVAAIPVNDTLKRVDARGVIDGGVSREGLWRMQTPQAFRYPLLLRAFDKARQDGFYGTDEVSLVERLGQEVFVVAGAESNIKITRPEDLALAEILLVARS